MTRNVPRARYDYGSPTAQPNDQWLIGQSLTFQYLLATHALPQAEAHRLAATAPGNRGYRLIMPPCFRPAACAAEQKLKMAEVLEPSNTELEQQQAYVAMDLQEWRQMELLTDDVLARAPRDRSVQRRTGSEMCIICLNCV